MQLSPHGHQESNPSYEIFFRHITEKFFDRYLHGFGVFNDVLANYSFAAYQSGYARTGWYEYYGDQFIFYLRADHFEKAVIYTPPTMVVALQNWGATWAVLTITLGVLAKQINAHCSSTTEMERTQNAYIQAVAWADPDRAEKLGKQLRMGSVQAGDCSDYQAETFATVSSFRSQVERLALRDPGWHQSSL